MKEARMIFKNKKGQVTIFVILALVIIVLGVAIYFLVPKIQSNSNAAMQNPETYFQNCVQKTLQNDATNISLQGGSLNPSPSYTYLGQKISYLCYSNEYYTPCVIQQALLIPNIEKQLDEAVGSKANECFNEMQSTYKKEGYQVSMNSGSSSVDLIKDKVIFISNTSLTLTKGSTSQYNSFQVSVNNNLYELASLANTIVAWEQNYGGSIPLYFDMEYPTFRFTKKLQDGWTEVYSIEDNSTGDVFQFATRSLAQPAGIITSTSG